MKINFVVINNGKGTLYPIYAKTIQSFIEPIRLHLPESSISNKSIPGAINVHFINQADYRNMVDAKEGTSVFICHGIADKHYWDGPLVNMFDYIGVPGRLWNDKLFNEGVPVGKILTIGYAKLDPIFQGLINKTPGPRKRVLWAPTHSNSPSSYPALLGCLDKFPADYEVIYSPHPYNNSNQMPTLQQLTDVDAVISDSGSLVYEAWALGKPVVFPDWLVKDEVLLKYPYSFEEKIYKEKIGLHATNFEDLLRLIYIAFNDGIDSRAKEFIEGVFPTELRGKSGKTAAQKLTELALQLNYQEATMDGNN